MIGTFTAWHFTGDRLRDGSPLPAVGEWEHCEGELIMCNRGLHWSRTPWYALQYAPGNNLRKVEIKGYCEEEKDKGVSHYRRTIEQHDVKDLLRQFACNEALIACNKAQATAQLWGVPPIVLNYLKTRDESLQGAARAVAASVSWRAAWSIHGNAMDNIALANLSSIVHAATSEIECAAARDAAGDGAERRFNALVYDLFGADEKTET
jgi:hypothetical protein